MLQAPRAGVVVALVRGGYLKAGVVPTDKELYEAAQRHYTDSLKDGVQVPRILAEQPPLGVKIESKAGKTAAQYDKHKARLYSKIYTPEDKGVFVQSRPDLAPDLATALAEAENHRKRVIKFNGKRTQFLGSPSTPPYVGPRRTKNTGHVPTVKDKRKSQAAYC